MRFTLRELVPTRNVKIDVPLRCDEVIARIRELVAGESFELAAQRHDPVTYYGVVREDYFRIRRYGRRMYIPTIIGHVTNTSGRCELSLLFVAPDGFIVPILLLAIGLLAVLQHQIGAVIAIGVFGLLHIPGCLVYTAEVNRFFDASGLFSSP